ncbi:UNKNOWN [Stylonychia lemnae]|uniref:RecQ mediated genome instability protein 1 OB-fold domain-containing protein n=1 Tax=Stylonychia lemnae TaxID=5949 RepID=A0A078AD41_STYLE|nr:UNKNOWN [Stylonychia lemnae]|eukprot:CDW80160.1 UNKNOWN [Stylonychia lemnae]
MNNNNNFSSNSTQLLQQLYKKNLYLKQSWLDNQFSRGLRTEAQIISAFSKEPNIAEAVNQTMLKKFDFNKELKVTTLNVSMIVQIQQAFNIGVSKRDQDEDVNLEEDDKDEDKFENKYLDPGALKEKKKINRDASRMMKITFTDGLNTFDAFEEERLKHIDCFGQGQKFLLKAGIEVRRGMCLLKNDKISYFGDIPIIPPNKQEEKKNNFFNQPNQNSNSNNRYNNANSNSQIKNTNQANNQNINSNNINPTGGQNRQNNQNFTNNTQLGYSENKLQNQNQNTYQNNRQQTNNAPANNWNISDKQQQSYNNQQYGKGPNQSNQKQLKEVQTSYNYADFQSLGSLNQSSGLNSSNNQRNQSVNNINIQSDSFKLSSNYSYNNSSMNKSITNQQPQTYNAPLYAKTAQRLEQMDNQKQKNGVNNMQFQENSEEINIDELEDLVNELSYENDQKANESAIYDYNAYIDSQRVQQHQQVQQRISNNIVPSSSNSKNQQNNYQYKQAQPQQQTKQQQKFQQMDDDNDSEFSEICFIDID